MSQKFPWTSPWIALPVAAVVAFHAPKSAYAATFGAVSDYNVFVLGDLNQKETDIEGRLAVGGNATIVDYAIASQLKDTAGLNSLVVGGNLSFERGQIFLGDATYGGTADLDKVAIPKGSFQQTQNVLDFAALGQQLKTYSSQLGQLAANTQTEYKWDGIHLQGSSSALNVFTVDGSKFATSTYLDFNNISSDSTVLVNVLGSKVDIKNFGLNLNGVNKQKVLFNFVEATELSTYGFAFKGSVLAANAHFDFNNGHIDGNLIAGSLSGTGESHNFKFEGDLPVAFPSTPSEEPAHVPEPSLLLGLAGVGSILRLRRRQDKPQELS